MQLTLQQLEAEVKLTLVCVSPVIGGLVVCQYHSAKTKRGKVRTSPLK